MAAALGLAGVTGCGTGSSEKATEEIPVDPYIIAQKPQQWVDWGSYVVVAEVAAEREIEVSYLLPVGEGRQVDLAVDKVLWSHPDAVTPVSAGQTVVLDVSPGWSDGSPVVLDGDTRMEVGDTYLLTVADSYDDGEQGFTPLFGSVSAADEGAVAVAQEQLTGLLPDPARAPRAGEPWDARFMRTRGYERP